MLPPLHAFCAMTSYDICQKVCSTCTVGWCEPQCVRSRPVKSCYHAPAQRLQVINSLPMLLQELIYVESHLSNTSAKVRASALAGYS